MDEIKDQGSLTQQADQTGTQTEGQTSSSGAIQDAPKADAAGAQQSAKAAEQEVFDWLKDDRYGRIWKGDPNKLYKSYVNLEKVYNPAKEELTSLKSKFDSLSAIAKEEGIELTPEIVKEVLGELKSWKDPNNPVIAKASMLDSYMSNDLYKSEVINFFQDLEKRELQRLYPNMNAEQIKKQIELENKIKQIEEKEQHENLEKVYKESLQTITSNVDECKKLAEKKGFVFTDDIKHALLDHCDKNGIDPKYVYAEFRRMYDEALDKAYEEKVKQSQLQNLNKNKNNVVLSPSKAGSTGLPSKSSLRESLSRAYDNMMGSGT